MDWKVLLIAGLIVMVLLAAWVAWQVRRDAHRRINNHSFGEDW